MKDLNIQLTCMLVQFAVVVAGITYMTCTAERELKARGPIRYWRYRTRTPS